MAGETLTIIGGSGGGKSVCLKMMIGLLRPDSGSGVLYTTGTNVPDLDADGLRLKIRRNVAYLFQGGALFDSMDRDVENISLCRCASTPSSSDARDSEQRAAGVPRDGGDAGVRLLRSHARKPFSGGMKKRVALARSIAIQPEVILYDEPTTGLDPKNITRIGDHDRQAAKASLGVTSIVVTHDMPMAHKVSDRIATAVRKAGLPVRRYLRADVAQFRAAGRARFHPRTHPTSGAEPGRRQTVVRRADAARPTPNQTEPTAWHSVGVRRAYTPGRWPVRRRARDCLLFVSLFIIGQVRRARGSPRPSIAHGLPHHHRVEQGFSGTAGGGRDRDGGVHRLHQRRVPVRRAGTEDRGRFGQDPDRLLRRVPVLCAPNRASAPTWSPMRPRASMPAVHRGHRLHVATRSA